MGSISGRPKSPSQPVQQVIYVPQNSSPEASSGPTEKEVLEARAENILKRSRSRLGTVLTGFRGILSPNDLSVPRKTLLGE